MLYKYDHSVAHLTHWACLGSHRRMEASLDPEAIRARCGCHSTHLTSLWWPRNTCSGLSLPPAHMFTRPSSLWHADSTIKQNHCFKCSAAKATKRVNLHCRGPTNCLMLNCNLPARDQFAIQRRERQAPHCPCVGFFRYYHVMEGFVTVLYQPTLIA